MRAPDPQPPRAGHLRPPGAPLGTIPRLGLSARLSGDERVVLVVAPPGYGKTEATRQWSERQDGRVGWLPVDLLDEAPAHFWGHLVQALGDVVEGMDDEPALLLAERGPTDPIFLDALIAQVERAGRGGALVIDDAWRLTEPSVIGGLALLVARIGHLVRFVIVDRADRPFPTALWRSRGWVTEIRADDLRFTDEEAIRAAAELPGLALSDATVSALNARAEGWPIGLHLALVSIASEPEAESRAQAIASSDRLLLDYLVSEVLDGLPPALRDAALSLSVLRWFDSVLCVGLLGEAALPAADELRRRRLFLTTIEGGSSETVRFHHLFRELLENELRWRDPGRRVRLHRRAAELWRERGDLTSAHHHLLAIGDIAAAAGLLLPVAAELVDHGGVTTLAEHMRRLPEGLHVDDAHQAFDLAQAWALAGGQEEAVHWCAVARHLSAEGDAAGRLRTHSTTAVIDLLRGSISSAWEHVERFDPIDAGEGPIGPVERQFPAVGARVALLAGRMDEAREWIDRAEALGRLQEPHALESVVVPALSAWWELERGDLERARREADLAVDHAEQLGLRPHLGAFDALIVAVRCRIGAGRLREADELLERVRADAAQLGWTLPRVRAGLLAAEVARLRSGPAAALAAIEDVRHATGPPCPAELELWLTAAQAVALIHCARFADARAAILRMEDDHRCRLLRARLAVASGSGEPVAPLLADRGGWSTEARLEGDLLVALAGSAGDDDGGLVSALVAGHETGWVSPFLDLTDAIQDRLGALRVEQLHPALTAAARAQREAARGAVPELVEPLTPRELTLLELLPTHLSYAEIGDRLYLSVNTIKSNLKAIYRKLEVSSRTDAVETAWRLGLLEPFTPTASPSAAETRPR